MPALPWYAYGIAAVVLGGGMVLFFWRRLKQAEADAWKATSLEAKEKHDSEMGVIEREQRQAAEAEKKKTGPVKAEDWSF